MESPTREEDVLGTLTGLAFLASRTRQEQNGKCLHRSQGSGMNCPGLSGTLSIGGQDPGRKEEVATATHKAWALIRWE